MHDSYSNSEATTSVSPMAWQLVKGLLRSPGFPASQVPPAREGQHSQLTAAIDSFLTRSVGASLCVSGPPGTGKTLTVQMAVAHKVSQLPHPEQCTVVTLNCMSLPEGCSVFGAIAASLDSKKLDAPFPSTKEGTVASDRFKAEEYKSFTREQLVTKLQKPGHRVTNLKRKRGASAAKYLVMVEEIDSLSRSQQEQLCDLYTLPYLTSLQMLLITNANSIDMSDRLLTATASRGCKPVPIYFPAYTVVQIMQVLAMRLGPHSNLFDKRALELCSRHVAGKSGDFRLVAKTCCTAVDLAAGVADMRSGTAISASCTVKVEHMSAALAKLAGPSMSCSTTAQTGCIAQLPLHQQLLLCAVAVGPSTSTAPLFLSTNLIRSGAKQGSNGLDVNGLYDKYVTLCRMAGVKAMSQPEANFACQMLSQMALLKLSTKKPAKVELGGKVSQGDVLAALGRNVAVRGVLQQCADKYPAVRCLPMVKT